MLKIWSIDLITEYRWFEKIQSNSVDHAHCLNPIFHKMLMLFQNPLPDTTFRGSKCPSMLVSEIFSGFRAPAGRQNYPLEWHFPPKNVPGCTGKSREERPGADLGAIWCRIRSKDTFSSIWGRFLIDFGRIFWTIFGACWMLLFKISTPY